MKSKEKIADELVNLQDGESIDEMALISEDGTTVKRFKMSGCGVRPSDKCFRGCMAQYDGC